MADQISYPLPEILRPFFWDTHFASLSWEADRDSIVRRILQSGGWSSISWLRSTLVDDPLKSWILAHNGRGLNPCQLRYWELILDLPSEEVQKWIDLVKDSPWEKRLNK